MKFFYSIFFPFGKPTLFQSILPVGETERIAISRSVYSSTNQKGHILKITEYYIDQSKNEMLNWEKNYTWNGKTMTIESKYGQPIIYTFH